MTTTRAPLALSYSIDATTLTTAARSADVGAAPAMPHTGASASNHKTKRVNPLSMEPPVVSNAKGKTVG